MFHRPMPLLRTPEPFDHPDWLYEVKHDGFRALAIVEGHCCRLVSRRGHTFTKWDLLCEEIAHSLRAMNAVIDGELVCLERKRRLRTIMPRHAHSRLRHVDHVRGRGVDLFHAACARDVEGIVCKWAPGCYEKDGVSTSWLKIKNPNYSQWEGWRELFEQRRDRRQHSRSGWRAPGLKLRHDNSADSR